MPPGRAHKKDPRLRKGEPAHHRDERTGRDVVIGKEIRQCGDAQSSGSRGSKCRTVVGFETPTWIDADYLVAVDESPGLHSLHKRFVSEEVVRRFGGAVRPNVVGTGDELAKDRSHTASDQI